MILFLLRFLLAVTLYLTLVLANQKSVIANILLVCGYRSLLIFSPFFEKVFRGRALAVSIILIIIGGILNFLPFDITSSVLIAAGLSLSGFFIKKIAAENPSSAGLNKISLSLGNITVGAILLYTHNSFPINNSLAISFVVVALIISLFSLNHSPTNRSVPKPFNHIEQKKELMPYFAWGCIGSAIGIRIFGLYSILPVFLEQRYGQLPNWYGSILTAYGVFVILSQLPAVMKVFKPSLQTALVVLSSSFVVLAFPSFFGAHLVTGAILWVFLLAIEEIYAPYIDFYSAKSNNLYLKEVSISIGGGLCVLLMRLFDNPILPSFLGFALVITGLIILRGRQDAYQ